MPTNTELLQMPLTLWAYLSSCAGMPMNAPACLTLWQVVMYFSFVMGGLLMFWAVAHYFRYRLQLKEAQKAQAERDMIANADTMRKFMWSKAGSIVRKEDLTDPHLAEKKQELDQQKQRGMTSKA